MGIFCLLFSVWTVTKCLTCVPIVWLVAKAAFLGDLVQVHVTSRKHHCVLFEIQHETAHRNLLFFFPMYFLWIYKVCLLEFFSLSLFVTNMHNLFSFFHVCYGDAGMSVLCLCNLKFKSNQTGYLKENVCTDVDDSHLTIYYLSSYIQ